MGFAASTKSMTPYIKKKSCTQKIETLPQLIFIQKKEEKRKREGREEKKGREGRRRGSPNPRCRRSGPTAGLDLASHHQCIYFSVAVKLVC
jgi:hypothetical protein